MLPKSRASFRAWLSHLLSTKKHCASTVGASIEMHLLIRYCGVSTECERHDTAPDPDLGSRHRRNDEGQRKIWGSP